MCRFDAMFELEKIIRPHLVNFKAYSSARDEYQGNDGIFLDANENPFDELLDYNRYPDPLQRITKHKIALVKNIAIESIFLGNGSDEAIDLLLRAFCEPGCDNIIICPPTYGMYATAAALNNVKLRRVMLTPDFQLNVEDIQQTIDSKTKLIFICSPNNPTGNLINNEDIRLLLKTFDGLIVIDEAYIDFSGEDSWAKKLEKYPNLVVLQTFSKAWGMAALRLGMAFASKEIIALLSAIKPPYNINAYTQTTANEILEKPQVIQSYKEAIIKNRRFLHDALMEMNIVKHIFPSDANFLLVAFCDCEQVFKYLINNKCIVRLRNKEPLCEDCIRITVGTHEENQKLLDLLKKY